MDIYIANLFIPAIVAMLSVRIIYFKILYLAKTKHLVDNPDARKLQKDPVPVMGGLAVYMGVLAGLGIACCFTSISSIAPVFISAGIMVYIGLLDDNLGLSPFSRLFFETICVLILIFGSNSCIDNLYGILGVYRIPWSIAVPLTVFAGVGIINSINMIDGVNGLSSGLCIICSLLFGLSFYNTYCTQNLLLTLILAFSLIPFLIHNVFGKSTRMFIGDAGTMMMGVTLTWFVIQTLATSESSCIKIAGPCNPVVMCLSILIVPIFDTLRVMTMRVLRGHSPFSADKTHLHHAFIRCGFSHVATSVQENLIGPICYLLCYYNVFSFSPSIQLCFVILYGIITVWGAYYLLEKYNNNKTIHCISAYTNYERKGWWLSLQNFLDAPENLEIKYIKPKILLRKIDKKFRN